MTKRRTLKEQAIVANPQVDLDGPTPETSQDFAPVETKNISLDQLVDKYLVRYERESIPENKDEEPFFENLSHLLENILKEQEEDEDLADDEPADEGDDGGLDLGGGDEDAGGGLDLGGDDGGDAGGEDAEADPIMNTPQINLNDFARSIARLISNYDALLDFKSVILNRTKEYIKNNYDSKTATELMAVLADNYNLKPVETHNTATPPVSPEFYAAGAMETGG